MDSESKVVLAVLLAMLALAGGGMWLMERNSIDQRACHLAAFSECVSVGNTDCGQTADTVCR